MKNKISIAVLTVILGMVFSTKDAAAYGGGGGFPPGYWDNVHARIGLVCHWEEKELPIGRSIYVPRCKVVREEVKTTASNNDRIQKRIAKFLSRLQNGNR